MSVSLQRAGEKIFQDFLMAVLALGLVTIPVTAKAQAIDNTGETARRYDATSPTGVSYANGAFTWSLPLVSIGQGPAPQSLSYSLSYNSGSNRSPGVAWTHGFALRMSWAVVEDLEAGIPPEARDGKPHPEYKVYRYSVVAGNRSKAFDNWHQNKTVNPFEPITISTATLAYDGVTETFTYTSENGDVVTFPGVDNMTGRNALGASWASPDGTIVTAGNGRYVTNRGMGLIIEPSVLINGEYETKICAVNFAVHVDDGSNTCPSGVNVAIVRGSASDEQGFRKVSSITLPDNSVYTFVNEPNRSGSTFERVKCIKLPGQSSCNITITYDNCDGPTSSQDMPDPFTFNQPYDTLANGSRDRVSTLSYADGRSVSYSYLPVTSSSSACRYNTTTVETLSPTVSKTLSSISPAGTIGRVTDGEGHLWQSSYVGENFTPTAWNGESTLPGTFTSPEGNTVEHIYDGYGREIETKVTSRDGTSTISTYATYPTGCPEPANCGKPLTTTDAKGNVTSYSYASDHGGVVLMTQPAVGGVSPKVRTSYTTKYAYVKNGSGGYVQAGPPTHVVNWTKTCRTTNWVNDTTGCAGGVSDQIMTQYLYGPQDGSAGNNLWVRGIQVTADGQTLTTCYQYDEYGNRIAETKPEAGLTSCS